MNRFYESKTFGFKKASYFVPIIAILTLANIFVFPASEAQARPLGDWYDCSWAYRKKITVAYTNVGATLTNFAVLVSVTDTNLRNTANGGHVAQSDGGDILFANPQLKKLYHEIEKYVATNGQLIAWVKADVLSSNVNTEIYMYYGGKDTNNQWSITNTWESSLKMVQHLNGTAFTRDDSTSNTNNGTPYGGVSSNVSGQVNGANSFDGTNGYVDTGNGASLNITNAITLEAWIYQNALTGTHQMIVNKDDGYYFALSSGDVLEFGYSEYFSGRRVAPIYNYVGAWYHIVATSTDGTVENTKLYRNGTEISSSVAASGVITSTLGVNIGAQRQPVQRFFNGTIDEVRIYNRALSAGEILTQYRNQNSPATFYSIGIEEPAPRITLITIF